jgi:transcriptional regulator with XRE-family HTH domain
MFEPLGPQIRLRRKLLGMTIDGLAVGAKVSRARLIALEKGDDNATLDLLVRIANALGLTELQIGGLHLVAAKPDFKAALATATAIQDAQELLDKVVEAHDQFRRTIGPVADLVASVIAPERARRRSMRGRKRRAKAK